MVPLRFIALVVVNGLLSQAEGRKWNNTGRGSVIFEEAFTIPEFGLIAATPPLGVSQQQLTDDLLDIHGKRLTLMDANAVDFMVLSCATPCIQGISDQSKAESMATLANDRLHSLISNNTLRFGAFAALAMHNATQAALELERTVTKLGFLGAMINDYQQSGADNATLFYYDRPEYDVFWQMVTKLDVPIYLHPRVNIPQIFNLSYGHAPFLKGAGQEFTVTLSNHILGLCTNGVFDRFPKLKIIVGHLGERIPSDLMRINEHLARMIPFGMPMLRNVSDYWRTNLFETTSGNFFTELFKFHVDQIGLDRILYSVDYPFIAMEDGETWIQSLRTQKVLNEKQWLGLRRELAIKLLKLNN